MKTKRNSRTDTCNTGENTRIPEKSGYKKLEKSLVRKSEHTLKSGYKNLRKNFGAQKRALHT